jgi:hypothetical protein
MEQVDVTDNGDTVCCPEGWVYNGFVCCPPSFGEDCVSPYISPARSQQIGLFDFTKAIIEKETKNE